MTVSTKSPTTNPTSTKFVEDRSSEFDVSDTVLVDLDGAGGVVGVELL